MQKIEYKVLHHITDEILLKRFECFNEQLKYYRDFESSKEIFDDKSFHLQMMIDGTLAAYTRLTPCPHNYMNRCKKEDVAIPCDDDTMEMGRTIVLPEFRGKKLVNTILLVGLRVADVMGYKQVIGNESYESHLSMPTANGWSFINVVADFDMPFSSKGKHLFYVIKCDLLATRELRQSRLDYYADSLLNNGYQLEIH